MKKIIFLLLILIIISISFYSYYKNITCSDYENTRIIGKIIPFEKSNLTKESLKEDEEIFYENVKKNFIYSTILENECDKREKSLEKLDNLLKNRKISGYF